MLSDMVGRIHNSDQESVAYELLPFSVIQSLIVKLQVLCERFVMNTSIELSLPVFAKGALLQ